MKRNVPLVSVLALGSVVVACEPDLSVDDWLVTRPRVLAVQSEPAEALPGTSLGYRILLATNDADPQSVTLSFELCTQPKSPLENNSVPRACLERMQAMDVGLATTFNVKTSANACALFGPNVPPGGYRPRDPDGTGGYYQPLRIDLSDGTQSFHFARLQCGLAGADANVARDFGQTYTPNHNPHLSLRATTADGVPLQTSDVAAGTTLTLEASWPAEDAETYAYFDRAALALTARREAMRVAWYASAGRLDGASGSRPEDDTETSVSTHWTLPTRANKAELWAVLRDSRGGSEWTSMSITLVP